MIKVLFICHGNICRSPMAEFIMKDLIEKAGKEKKYEISSAATSREEIGNPVYPPARSELLRHGIDPGGKYARQITWEDYEKYDYLIGMDHWNLRNMKLFWAKSPEGIDPKVKLLLNYIGEDRDVEDPWYTDDYKKTYQDILAGCRALFEELEKINVSAI